MAPAYLSDLCAGTAAVPGRSGVRSAVQGDPVVAGPKCWNKFPVGLRDLSVGPESLC